VSEPIHQGSRSWSPATALRVEQTCDRFEAAWQAGNRPVIEDHLRDAAEPERSALLHELLALELEYRRRVGEKPSLGEYLARFPRQAEVLNPFFVESASPATLDLRQRNGPAAAKPPRPTTDRNLLFGILALQLDFLGRDDFIAAMHAWLMEKHKALGQILLQRQLLTADEHALLEGLVQMYLHRHDNDAQKSLAATGIAPGLCDDLRHMADQELQASLTRLTAAGTGTHNAYAPAGRSLGSNTSAGWRFHILRPHAQGGLGIVSVARDAELNREVALKEIQEQHADHAESRARFLLEAEITGRLEHPGVVPVYGLGTYSDGRPFYAMRLVKGETLQDAIRSFHRAQGPDRNPGDRAVAFRHLLGRFVAVCQTVAYAHSRGVLHRDLKPANIMLGSYGETLILDWGLAKATGRGDGATGPAEEALRPSQAGAAAPTQMGAALGTPHYMSPEQAAGQFDVLGPASDVYGLGATLFCLLTGRAPFTDADAVAVLENVKRGLFPRPRQLHAELPAALEAICLKAMARKPEGRYASANALADDIEHYLADEPVAAYGEPIAARLGRWARRHRPILAGAVVLLLTAVVALTVGFMAVNRERQRTADALQAEARRRSQTLRALDAMSSQVIEQWLAKQKELLPEHKEFLQDALNSYEEFARDTGQDEQSRAGAAAAFRRVGLIRWRLGEAKDAEAAYRRSQVLYRLLNADFPNRPNYRRELARTLNFLGSLLSDTERAKEAEKVHRAALILRQHLADDFRQNPDYRQDLAQTQKNLAVIMWKTGRLSEAQKVFHATLGLRNQLAKDFPDRPSYQRDLALSHNDVAALLREMGQPKLAEKEFQAALDLYNRLVAKFPNRPDYREGLGITHNNLANLYLDTDRPEKARKAYRAGLEIYKHLAAEFYNRPDYRQALATSHNNLAILLANMDSPKEAEEAQRIALAIRKQLVKDFRQRAAYRKDLADSYNDLATMLVDAGRDEEAVDIHRAALRLRKELAKDFQDQTGYRQDLARSYNNLAGVLRNTGRIKEAELAYHNARRLYKQLASDFPAVPDHQNELANTLEGLAQLANLQGKYADACAWLAQAHPHSQAALGRNKRHPFYRAVFRNCRQTMAKARLGLGEHAAAAAAAEELGRFSYDSVNDPYQAAGFLARCMLLAEKDAQLPRSKRRELAGRYAQRALDLLRQAVASGYNNAKEMKTDKALARLRDHPDFQRILTKLGHEKTGPVKR
jgi:serine/threonine-protein kinase